MKRRHFLSMDLTPLIDVVFILLIFFLVSSVFKKEELAIALNLPTSKQAPAENNKDNITIELGVQKIAFKGKIIDFAALGSYLQNIKNPKTLMVVYIDKKVQYQRITELFDMLKKYNLNNLSLQSIKS